MKKNTFSILLAALLAAFLLTLFVTCADTVEPEKEEDYSVDVVYSNDWRYISIYLDDVSVPISVKYNNQSAPKSAGTQRAMTADTAKRGFDYFEVFFYYKGTVTRAAWEIGKRASIMDVYRTNTEHKTVSGTKKGIDYSVTSIKSSEDGSACAILFAGRKEGKTLLAVGKLVSVDMDEPVENPQIRDTFVNTGTAFVTFELFAITANTSLEAEKSSFLINDKGTGAPSAENTKVIPVTFTGYNEKKKFSMAFPLYILPGGKIIQAQYNLGLSGNWDDFSGSLFVMRKGEADKRKARYPAGSGKYWYATYPEDLTTGVKMTNNQSSWVSPNVNKNAVPLELQNPVTFTIDTSETIRPIEKSKENGIFTLIFEIPVYPISPYIPLNQDDCWYIRPAYSSAYYNIDNGITGNMVNISNNGGGVLIGVGVAGNEFEIPADLR